MKVWVYKVEGGGMSVLVQASPGKGKPPVLLKGITLENLADEVLPVVEEMRRPKEPKQGLV